MTRRASSFHRLKSDKHDLKCVERILFQLVLIRMNDIKLSNPKKAAFKTPRSLIDLLGSLHPFGVAFKKLDGGAK